MTPARSETTGRKRFVRLSNDGKNVYVDPTKVSVISPSGDYLMFTTLVVEGQQVIVDEDSDEVLARVRAATR